MSHPVAKIISAYAPLSYQDAGRPGWRRFGVPQSGVMDPISASMANRMVDNYASELVVEFAFGGVELEMLEDATVAIVGAGGLNRTVDLQTGQKWCIASDGAAVWGYIAIKGGWNAEHVLGSGSYHGRSKMGSALTRGSELFSFELPQMGQWSRFVADSELSSLDDSKVIRICRGPHVDLFDEADGLCHRPWRVSTAMDRTGYRLEQVLQAHDFSVESFPLMEGCLQVPPSGHPIVTMPDGPTVGGYPVVAVIHPEDLPRVVQTGPGMELQFRWYDCNKL